MAFKKISPAFAALTHYWRSALKPDTPLSKAIVRILWLKIATVLLLWVFFFSGDKRPNVDAEVMRHAFGVNSSSSSQSQR